MNPALKFWLVRSGVVLVLAVVALCWAYLPYAIPLVAMAVSLFTLIRLDYLVHRLPADV